MVSKKRLIIIDSNALLHRSFHALPPLTTKKGEQTGAVYGFLLTLFKAIKDLKPDFIAACFDTPGITFRHKEFREYKAKRPKVPEELSQQMPKLKKILKEFEIPFFEKEGFEADDLIATISKKAPQEQTYPPLETYILSGDLDTLQLVTEKTKVYTFSRGLKEPVIYDKEKILARFGISPSQMIDFKALAGDPSDNISGVPGIGKKTAGELLKKFGSLKNLYQKIEKGKIDIKPRLKEILLESKEEAFLSQSLVRAKRDVSIDFNIKNCQFGNFNPKKVEKVFKKFDFYSLLNRLPSLLANKH
jgi:DNA polymerase-1